MNLVLKSEDIDMEKKYPIYPTLEQGTYSEELEKSYNEAEEQARKQEEKARRDRDVALIGDMAHLFSQSAAMHGGAWKVDKINSTAAAGNEKLRALQERNIAQTAQFAKERAALRDAKRKEENAAKVAQYNAEVEQYKRNLDEARRAEDMALEREKLEEQKTYHENSLGIQKERNARLSQRGTGGGGGSSTRTKYTPYTVGGKVYSYDEYGNRYIQKAYEALANSKPEYKVLGYKLVDNGFGYDSVPYDHYQPSLDEMISALERYELATAGAGTKTEVGDPNKYDKYKIK